MLGWSEWQDATSLRDWEARRRAGEVAAGTGRETGSGCHGNEEVGEQVRVTGSGDAQCADRNRQRSASSGRLSTTHETFRETTPCPATAQPRRRPVGQERRSPATARGDQRFRGIDTSLSVNYWTSLFAKSGNATDYIHKKKGTHRNKIYWTPNRTWNFRRFIHSFI